jgi:r-opsin
MSNNLSSGYPSVAYRSEGASVLWGYPPGLSIVDLVPDDMKEFIHPHWNKFPPVNPMWHYLLVIFFLLQTIAYIVINDVFFLQMFIAF